MGFETLEDAVYMTLHVPDAKVQEDELNVPPTLPSFQVIVPVGVFCVFVGSVTVAVTVIWAPEEIVVVDDTTVTDAVS
jgi:hypothetical protein